MFSFLLLSSFPPSPLSLVRHSSPRAVRLPHCFLAFHRTCTDHREKCAITQQRPCRSPRSPALISPARNRHREPNETAVTGPRCPKWVYTSGKMLVNTAWLSLALLLAAHSLRLETSVAKTWMVPWNQSGVGRLDPSRI